MAWSQKIVACLLQLRLVLRVRSAELGSNSSLLLLLAFPVLYAAMKD